MSAIPSQMPASVPANDVLTEAVRDELLSEIYDALAALSGIEHAAPVDQLEGQPDLRGLARIATDRLNNVLEVLTTWRVPDAPAESADQHVN